MPNILLETMAFGLPIASSNCGPCKEIIGPEGVYFNPENPIEIEVSIKSLIENVNLRSKLAQNNFSLASQFKWKRCAIDTLNYLKLILDKNK